LGEARPAYTSAAAATGFAGAAGGVFSLIHAALGIRDGVVPAVTGCAEPDPSCQLNLIREPRRGPIHRALVWSSDRGIKNAALLLSATEA
jgi:3-oxoacyl-(acyl-carrier-protein) synthase